MRLPLAPDTVCLVGLGVLLTAIWPAPVSAQLQRAGMVASEYGEVTVTHETGPEPIPLHMQDPVFLLDRIDTREDSGARVLLGGKATVTVRELSTLTITEEPGRAVVELQTGTLALRVNKARVRPGESVEVQTPNAIVAVRGSFLVAEVSGSADAPQTRLTALEATLPIVVTPRSDPTRVIPLAANQSVSISGLRANTKISPVRKISPAESRRVARLEGLPRDSKPGREQVRQQRKESSREEAERADREREAHRREEGRLSRPHPHRR